MDMGLLLVFGTIFQFIAVMMWAIATPARQPILQEQLNNDGEGIYGITYTYYKINFLMYFLMLIILALTIACTFFLLPFLGISATFFTIYFLFKKKELLYKTIVRKIEMDTKNRQIHLIIDNQKATYSFKQVVKYGFYHRSSDNFAYFEFYVTDIKNPVWNVYIPASTDFYKKWHQRFFVLF